MRIQAGWNFRKGQVSADPVKASAVAAAKSLRNPISARTVERAFAKVEGRKPRPKPKPKPKPAAPEQDLEAIEVEQRARLLKVYQQSLPVVRRWFRMQIGAER
jgi:hypothetical protein